MGYTTGVQFWEGAGIFFCLSPHSDWFWDLPYWGLSWGVKWPETEVNHSPTSSIKVKNVWKCTSTVHIFFMVWLLIKHRIHPHGMILG